MKTIILSFFILTCTFLAFGNEGASNDIDTAKKRNKTYSKEQKKNKLLFALSKIDLTDEQKSLLKDLYGDAPVASNNSKLNSNLKRW